MTPNESKQALKALCERFIKSVEQDVKAGRHPENVDNYREYYLEHLRKNDSALYEHLRNIQTKKGDPRVLGDVDHIIPRSVWTTLTGFADRYASVLTNLWIRDDYVNRRYDHQMIGLVRKEGPLTDESKERWIGLFLALKERDIEGYPWVPKSFSQLSRWEKEQLVTGR
jgi:hypothetical protein